MNIQNLIYFWLRRAGKRAKKAPLLRPGQRHLDYGMMFSGHIENQHTIKLKSAGLMEKSWRK
jgi:hypothetical protein